jgi:hypothetical protein
MGMAEYPSGNPVWFPGRVVGMQSFSLLYAEFANKNQNSFARVDRLGFERVGFDKRRFFEL